MYGGCESASRFSLKNLIIVPGHAAFKSDFSGKTDDFSNPNIWSLLPYQTGDIAYYLEHIRRAMELATADAESMLIFSGSWTRKDCGDWSEALSYKTVALSKCETCQESGCYISDRVCLEEYSLDSFQNVKNSLDLFRNIEGRDPENIKVVGWGFKESRFNFHCHTVGYQLDKFQYLGVNNPEDLSMALEGESKTLKQFLKDPFGEGEILSQKRQQRDFKNLYVTPRVSL